MNKLAFILLAVVASKGALAGEVGANTPNITETVTLAYVVTDAGTSENDWAIGPVKTPATKTQHNQMASVLEKLNKDINQKVSQDLERMFSAVQ